MKRLPVTSALVLLLSFGTNGFAADENAGGKKTGQAKPQSQHMQHGRGPKKLMLAGAEGATIKLWKPDLTTLELEAKMGVIALPSTGVDNYHAVVAEKDWGDIKESVIRYEWMRGKPSGESPTKLTAAIKTAFEIVPDPIPRGHYHYHSDQEWDFILRFQDKPVGNLPVTLQTANGSVIKATSDSKGRVSFLLPEDFPEVVEGKRDRRSADFALSAEYSASGITYQTLLSAEYRLNQKHWNSGQLGLLVGGLGLIAGGFIGRISSREKKA
jgi:hypothetical protein